MLRPGMLDLVSMWTIYDRRCAPHRRVEVSLVAALSLANDNEHVDTGGRASEALNSHECWWVFCDVMASDGQLQFSVPDAVIIALNREHRKEALLGADFQLKERLLNAASLVVSSTPGTMWKALQKIARVFGLKATKGKATAFGASRSASVPVCSSLSRCGPSTTAAVHRERVADAMRRAGFGHN